MACYQTKRALMGCRGFRYGTWIPLRNLRLLISVLEVTKNEVDESSLAVGGIGLPLGKCGSVGNASWYRSPQQITVNRRPRSQQLSHKISSERMCSRLHSNAGPKSTTTKLSSPGHRCRISSYFVIAIISDVCVAPITCSTSSLCPAKPTPLDTAAAAAAVSPSPSPAAGGADAGGSASRHASPFVFRGTSGMRSSAYKMESGTLSTDDTSAVSGPGMVGCPRKLKYVVQSGGRLRASWQSVGGIQVGVRS